MKKNETKKQEQKSENTLKPGEHMGLGLENMILKVDGPKGGVGKSMFCVALATYLIDRGHNPVIVDADYDNADVYHTFKDTQYVGPRYKINSAIGWDRCFSDLETMTGGLEGMAGRPVLINTPGQMMESIQSYGPSLASAPKIMERLRTCWVLNPQKDSISMLRTYMDIVPAPTIAVKNHNTGSLYDFFDSTKTAQKCVFAITMSKLIETAANLIYTNRLSIHKILDEGTLINGKPVPGVTRGLLTIWKNAMHEQFDVLFGYSPAKPTKDTDEDL